MMSFFQLERAADVICKGESVDCREHQRVRRIDGKCNNLENEDWGATATRKRRLVFPPGVSSTDYADGLHAIRKVDKIFFLI